MDQCGSTYTCHTLKFLNDTRIASFQCYRVKILNAKTNPIENGTEVNADDIDDPDFFH